MRRVGLGVGAAVVAGLLGTPGEARASSCAAQMVLVWPKDGATVPRNAALLFEQVGCGDTFLTNADPIGYEVFIDDVLVELEEDPDPRFGGNGRWIDPAPAVGSTVLVTNCDEQCAAADPPSVGVRVEVTIAEPDDDRPPPASLGALDYTLGAVEDTHDGMLYRYRDWELTVRGATPTDPRVYRVAIGIEGALE